MKFFNYYTQTHNNLNADSVNHFVICIFNIKIKFKYTLKPHNNRVFIKLLSGKKKRLSPLLMKFYGINTKFTGNNNTLIIHAPINSTKGDFHFYGSNNLIIFGQNNKGKWGIACYEDNNKAKIGNHNECCNINIALVNSKILVGSNNMFSNNIKVWADGHSVIDYNTKEILNLPKKPIRIGNHIWLGERVTLTKNAEIPNDTIVGIASVVTKKFTEEHTIIAGCPAKVVKRGITWHGITPTRYLKENPSKILVTNP